MLIEFNLKILQMERNKIFYINFYIKPKFHLLRHVTTRHDSLYLAHAFWYRKTSYVLCRACCTASMTQHVTTSATGAIRNLVCNVYKVMMAVISLNKRI